MQITWIGHATFLIQSNKLTIMTDPWFGESFFYRRLVPPAIKTGDISSCDLVLVSHAHGDHFDRQGLDLAARLASRVIGPSVVVRKAKKRGIEGHLAEPGQTLNIVNVKILVTPAHHPAPGAKGAVGYILTVDEKKVYFAGDTLLFPELIAMLKQYTIDLAFLPIGPYKLFGRKMGMDVSGALSLIKETRPRAVIPMHYNCLKGTGADPNLLAKAEAGYGSTRIILLAPGQIAEV